MSEDGGDASSPVYADADIVRLFRPLEHYPEAILAVSGGPDSVALMVLAARWCTLSARPLGTLHVATVDHGLRQASAAEAEFVAELASRMGFAHTTLAWTGPKPRSGVQAAARMARYTLLSGLASANNCRAIVTAHTLDDQAETFMMRLARGSGLSGLSAMAPIARMMDVDIVRPLLGERKARLRRLLGATATPFIEDPSNEDAAFERVRMRRALARLGSSGIGPDQIALSAARLRRARAAIDSAARDMAAHALAVHPSGYAETDLSALAVAPEEIAIVLLEKVLRRLGGASPVRLARIEALADRLRVQTLPARVTLGGCLMERKAGRLRIFREPGRMGHPHLRLVPGETSVWDGRFRVSLSAGAQRALDVAPIGADWKAMAEQTGCGLPRLAIETGPAFRLDGRIVAAPQLGLARLGDDPASGFAALVHCELLDPFEPCPHYL